MRRRELLSLVGSGLAIWPSLVAAQERVSARRIGVIMNYAEADSAGQARFAAIRAGLHKLGWTEGTNVQIEIRWTAGNQNRMRATAAELISMPVDVIVANSTPLLGVLKPLTQTIPIVFVQVADPVSSGFVSSYARPAGNITGFTDFDNSIAGKWIEVLKEAAPFVGHVTVLSDPNQSNHQAFLRVIESTAPLLKMQMTAVKVRDQAEIEQTLSTLAGKTDHGLVVLPGPVNNTLRDTIIQSAARNRVPAVYPFRYYSKDGGLLYYGIDQVDQWPKAAEYVDRILRGGKLSELPVQAPTKFELVINLKTAKVLGIDIPPALLARADEVIE
jgi:putative ABC transport system substrate-binding protein